MEEIVINIKALCWYRSKVLRFCLPIINVPWLNFDGRYFREESMGQWTSIGTGRTIRPALGTWSTSTGWGTKTCIAWRRRRATHSASTWKTGRTAPRTPSTTSFPWGRNWTLFTGKLASSWRLAVTQERRVSTDVRHRHWGLAIVTLIRNQQESSRTSRN